jgi:hypothetical protein
VLQPAEFRLIRCRVIALSWAVRALRKLFEYGAPMVAVVIGAALFLLGLFLSNSDVLTSGLIVAFIGVNLYILRLLLEFIIDSSGETKRSTPARRSTKIDARAWHTPCAS